jgi:3-deoxy-manno-octulosonate cytidylyltransferase (CMP-KDO synthetase)
MGSSRFPGKPLASINGKPMIGHVYERALAYQKAVQTVVATCDHEIKDYIHSIGGCVVMTSNSHERASDRCAEALLQLEKRASQNFDIVTMVQGDEPLVVPQMLQEAISPFLTSKHIKVANLCSAISSESEFNDPSCIKVVRDSFSNALYFSRSPIPFARNGFESIRAFKQVCIIPFTRDFLLDYIRMPPTPLEVFESIDMMRVLENGFKVRLVETSLRSIAVDLPSHIPLVEEYLRNG